MVITFDFGDVENLHPGASLLSKVHLAAEDRNLDHLFDAYQTFCLISNRELSWRSLAKLMELATQSPYLMCAAGETRLVLRPEDPYKVFLSELTIEDLGYHVSDIVVAFLHYTGVLQEPHHIEREMKGLDVVDWTTKGPEDLQAIVRTVYLQFSRPILCVLFEGINEEIVSRTRHWNAKATAPSNFYTPCSGSLLEILLHLDVQIDAATSQLIEQRTSRARARPTKRWKFQPQTRPTSQRASFFRLLRDPQGTQVPLNPIQEQFERNDKGSEDDSKSVVSMATYNGNDQWKRSSKRSSFSDYRSFVTALTHGTGSSLRKSILTAQSQRSGATNATTHRSSIQTFLSWPTNVHDSGVKEDNEWSLKLRLLRNIVSDPELEAWSEGRGQHAKFSPEERDIIPLVFESQIGKGSTAVVDAVICRQVRLVRKVIMLKYSKRLREIREQEAMSEVQQLYRAQHAHIVRLVGTYVIDRELAILTYPRAEWSLEQFLTTPPTEFIEDERRGALQRFFGCLARVMDFIHSCPIKHMDIKPQNILVRNTRKSSIDSSQAFQVYLTDFGSSKFYPSAEDTETDSPTPYTRIYAAKEVLLDDFRGLPADVFSMGCVFAEMLATAIDFAQDSSPQEALLDACGATKGKRKPFCTRVTQVRQWLEDQPINESHTTFLAVRHWISLMLSDDPQERPSARELINDTRLTQQCSSCNRATPEAFERILQG